MGSLHTENFGSYSSLTGKEMAAYSGLGLSVHGTVYI